MRKLITAAAGLAVLSLLLTTGCQSTPRRITYTTLNTVAITVDAARGAYVEYYQAGNVGAQTHAKVVSLDRKYTDAMHVAITGAQYDWTTPVTADVAALATQLLQLIEEVRHGSR